MLTRTLSPRSDIDECHSEEQLCSRNAVCENALGSYTCRCDEGYTGDGITCLC